MPRHDPLGSPSRGAFLIKPATVPRSIPFLYNRVRYGFPLSAPHQTLRRPPAEPQQTGRIHQRRPVQGKSSVRGLRRAAPRGGVWLPAHPERETPASPTGGIADRQTGTRGRLVEVGRTLNKPMRQDHASATPVLRQLRAFRIMTSSFRRLRDLAASTSEPSHRFGACSQTRVTWCA